MKYLVEGVRASEASLNTQKRFSGMIFLSGIYDLRMSYLDPATSQALRRVVDGLRQDIESRMTEDWVDAVFPPSGMFCERLVPGIIPDRRRPIVTSYSTGYDSSGTAFSGDAATSSSGVVLSHSPKNASSLKPLFRAHRYLVVTRHY
jgi:hypothetical protein